MATEEIEPMIIANVLLTSIKSKVTRELMEKLEK
jgi:hypothetical protein